MFKTWLEINLYGGYTPKDQTYDKKINYYRNTHPGRSSIPWPPDAKSWTNGKDAGCWVRLKAGRRRA